MKSQICVQGCVSDAPLGAALTDARIAPEVNSQKLFTSGGSKADGRAPPAGQALNTPEHIQSQALQNLGKLRACIEAQDSIAVCRDGSWSRRWTITKIFRRIFGLQKSDDLELLKFFDYQVRSCEVCSRDLKNGIGRSNSYDEIALTAEAIKKRVRYWLDQEDSWLGLSKLEISKAALLTKIRSPIELFQNEGSKAIELNSLKKEIRKIDQQITEAKKQAFAHVWRWRLDRDVLAYKFRQMSAADIARNQVADFNDRVDWLKKSLLLWKEQQYPALSPGLSEDEIKKIEETCRYEGIVDLLKDDPVFRIEYFKFCWCNFKISKDAPHMACQFPQAVGRVSKGFLDKRAQRLNNSGIKFVETQGENRSKKDLQILINGEYVSLLDEKKTITFSDKSTFTLGQILNSFAAKNDDMGEFEYLQKGISHSTPKFPAVNLESGDWWKELPTYEILSKAELEKKFEEFHISLKDDQGIIAVCGSKKYPDEKRVDDNHSYFLAAIPLGDGTYKILPFGKYAEVYPKGILETFFYTFQTKKATICYPDENEFLNNREHFFVPHIAEKEHLRRWLEKVRLDLKLAREGAIIFQAQGNNCATWVQKTLDCAFNGIYQGKPIPRYFETEFINTTGPVPVNHIVYVLKLTADYVSKTISNTMRIVLGIICGALMEYEFIDPIARTKSSTSLWCNKNWRAGKFYLPSGIFRFRSPSPTPSPRQCKVN